MATLFSTYTQQEEQATATPPLFHINIKPTPSYDGEFGFDWMRLGSVTNDLSEDNNVISGNFTLLESQYENINIVAGKKYYVPWLCMFPNHGSVIGKDVELMLSTNAADIDQNIDLDDLIEIKPSDNSLEIIPNTIKVSDLFNGIIIKILCNSPLSSDASIEFTLFSESLNDAAGKLVGKINVVKNSDHSKYKINIYMIYSYLTDNPLFDQSIIENKLNAMGGLSKLEDYLNKNSLNQALIQVKFCYRSNNDIFDWGFRKRTLEVVSAGKDPATDTPSVEYSQFAGLIVDPSNMTVDAGKYITYINSRFKLMSFREIKRGICLYLTSLQANDAGGAAYVVPLNNTHCVIFKSNLTRLSSYAHEIGHTLGLYHTFLDGGVAVEDSISQEDTVINNNILAIQQSLSQHFAANVPYYTMYPDKKTELQTTYNKEIAKLRKRKNEYASSMRRDNIKSTKGQTFNIMDYSSTRTYFTRHQWKIMQEETIQYYNEK